MLFQEAFADPLEAVPAVDEDEAADVLVEGEDQPHCDKAPSECDTENIASDHLYAPHHDDSEDDREVDVSCTSEGIHSEEIECTSILQKHLDPKDYRTCRYDPWI